MQTSILVKQKVQCRKQNHDEEAVTTVGNFELVDSKEVPEEPLVNYNVSSFPIKCLLLFQYITQCIFTLIQYELNIFFDSSFQTLINFIDKPYLYVVASV